MELLEWEIIKTEELNDKVIVTFCKKETEEGVKIGWWFILNGEHYGGFVFPNNKSVEDSLKILKLNAQETYESIASK